MPKTEKKKNLHQKDFRLSIEGALQDNPSSHKLIVIVDTGEYHPPEVLVDAVANGICAYLKIHRNINAKEFFGGVFCPEEAQTIEAIASGKIRVQ